MSKPVAVYEPVASMDLFVDPSASEKAQVVDQCRGHGPCRHQQRQACRHWKLKMASLVSLGIFLLGLVFFVLAAYVSGDGVGVGIDGGDPLMFWKRQFSGVNGSSTNNESPFTKNKLWIIVLVVGLFLCIIAGVMLSAWCCRGAFDNPLCCPCYLCACCGGLACLECISCGLCAELGDQM